MFGLILAGGAGTRLWPKSRKYWPKFLLKIFGNRSLIQETFLRVKKFIPVERIFIITNKEHKFLVKENIQDLGINFPVTNIVSEPEMKNTLPAICVISKFILEKFAENEVLGVFPADHYIKETKEFSEIVKSSVRFAEEGNIVLFGIKPTRVETGYGYIKVQSSKFKSQNLKLKIQNLRLRIRDYVAYKIEKFIEKPDKTTVEKLLSYKNVYWNSGIFMFKPSILLEETKKYEPEIYKYISTWDLNFESLKKFYPKLKNISIDKGVIEKSDKTVCVPLKISWDDVGNWSALERVYEKDFHGNIILGKNVDIKSKNITVVGDKRLIATLGLKDIFIVDTEDALIVGNKKYVEEVKNLVEKITPDETVLYHKTTERPWGKYTILEHKKGYKVKIIQVLPQKRLSLQKHKKRSEQWFVVNGKAEVVCGRKRIVLNEGDKILVPKNVQHRLSNPSKNELLEIIEISRGKYLGEDDIIRLEDDFLRK